MIRHSTCTLTRQSLLIPSLIPSLPPLLPLSSVFTADHQHGNAIHSSLLTGPSLLTDWLDSSIGDTSVGDISEGCRYRSFGRGRSSQSITTFRLDQTAQSLRVSATCFLKCFWSGPDFPLLFLMRRSVIWNVPYDAPVKCTLTPFLLSFPIQ